MVSQEFRGKVYEGEDRQLWNGFKNRYYNMKITTDIL